LGWILVEQGQLSRGLGLLSKAANKAPESANFRYHYGAALAQSGKKQEAKRELEAALANGLGSPEQEAAKALLKSL
jgi:Flp pilus assembly protein TadD